MNPAYQPPRPGRQSYYPVGLGILFAVCATVLLIGVSGGLLTYVLVAAAAIALLALLHYAVWGHNAPGAGAALPGAGTATPDAWQRERDREGRH